MLQQPADTGRMPCNVLTNFAHFRRGGVMGLVDATLLAAQSTQSASPAILRGRHLVHTQIHSVPLEGASAGALSSMDLGQ